MVRLLAVAALLAGVTFQHVTAQFVPAPQDLKTKMGFANVSVRYKEVPNGICELNPNVKSYSGYADVEDDQHIFFWFFEARKKDPTTAPLTVWINGGPGSTSMIGWFFRLTRSANRQGKLTTTARSVPRAWSMWC
jgi:carboxypeptidase C (cathepsin A)